MIIRHRVIISGETVHTHASWQSSDASSAAITHGGMLLKTMEIGAPWLPVSQLTPVYPVEQEHAYVVPVTEQIPFTQGLLSHGVISETLSTVFLKHEYGHTLE